MDATEELRLVALMQATYPLTKRERRTLAALLAKRNAQQCINPKAREAGWGVAFCACPACEAARKEVK